MSRLFIYYNARVRSLQPGMTLTDSGCNISNAIESLKEYGTCLEKNWPFDGPYLNTRPQDYSYNEARGNVIMEAMKVNIDLNSMKSCLAKGYPFVFGLKLYVSFHRAMNNGGWVPTPAINESVSTQHKLSVVMSCNENVRRLFLFVLFSVLLGMLC
jgi:hypothetical protein